MEVNVSASLCQGNVKREEKLIKKKKKKNAGGVSIWFQLLLHFPFCYGSGVVPVLTGLDIFAYLLYIMYWAFFFFFFFYYYSILGIYMYIFI